MNYETGRMSCENQYFFCLVYVRYNNCERNISFILDARGGSKCVVLVAEIIYSTSACLCVHWRCGNCLKGKTHDRHVFKHENIMSCTKGAIFKHPSTTQNKNTNQGSNIQRDQSVPKNIVVIIIVILLLL